MLFSSQGKSVIYLSLLDFEYFLLFLLILSEIIKPKDPQTVWTAWKRGEGISLASKSFDSWHGNEPIPTKITSLLLIFPGYQSIYEPLLTSREVLMNQVFKNNIHQEVVNYSPSILWMNSHATFPTPTWYPSAATCVFIQGLNLWCTNMCLGFHQALILQHPAWLSVLIQQKNHRIIE